MKADSDPIARAMALYQAGDLPAAAELCRRALADEPFHVEALYLLGTICYQAGDDPSAIGHLEQAVAVSPQRPELLNVLALALARAARPDDAEARLRSAIEAAPDFAQAHNNLGSLLKRQGKLPEAAASQRRAAELDPGNPTPHYNLGLTLRAMNDAPAACECFQKAFDLQPDFADAMAALGEALHAIGRPGEAVDALRKAVDLAPDDAPAHRELGDALQTMGRLEEAVDAYRGALEKDPSSVPAHYAMGCAQSALQRYADAIGGFRQVIASAPDHAPSHHNLAKVLLELGRMDEAMEHFAKAASIDPGGPALTALAVSIPGAPSADNRTVLDVRRRLGEKLAAEAGRTDTEPPPPAARPDGRLRLAYISGFFQSRNWMKPVWPLVNEHDRGRFEIHLLSDAPEAAVAYGYRKHPADRFHDISGLANADVARLIADARIDLLVDLNGYSYTKRLGLFARKPAPLVVGWFNMYATTGLACFDYLIGDRHAVPPAEEQFYSERIVRVDGSYLTFRVNYPVPDVAEPPCLCGGGLTFGCLASQYKITPQVIDTWSEVLRQCPDSRLVLKNATLSSDANRRFVREAFEQAGLPADRIELEGPSEHYAFLKKYDEIDLALDTFPYNGGTTTTEAIWQGVPVATFSGDRWASRTSASILHAGGLSDFVADDVAGYIGLAVDWATAPDRAAKLAELRANMRPRLAASPVCDTETFARNMERLYADMWRRREG